MDNFYTVTVYEKGAEIIRVYHTLLGKQGFRWGMRCDFSIAPFDVLPLSDNHFRAVFCIKVPCTVGSKSQTFLFPCSILCTCSKCILWSMLWCAQSISMECVTVGKLIFVLLGLLQNEGCCWLMVTDSMLML